MKRQGRQRFKFVGETISELKKVTWPTRQEATHLTVIVIIVCIAVAIVLGLLDQGFSSLMKFVLR